MFSVMRDKCMSLSIFLSLFSLAWITVMPAAAGTVILSDDFETCDYSRWDSQVTAKDSQITELQTHSGKCASRTGGDGAKSGNLVRYGTGEEFWMTGWLFFPSNFVLPAPGGGIHIWRLWNPSAGFQLDFNVPDRSSTIQIVHFPGKSGGKEVVKWTGFNPIAGDRIARWQCWEAHARLNQPGKADGLVEFYADGKFVGSISGNFRGSNTSPYIRAAFASNIGGAASLWPKQNWWYLDDVVLSMERVGCQPDVADTTPPGSPTGVRINSQ